MVLDRLLQTQSDKEHCLRMWYMDLIFQHECIYFEYEMSCCDLFFMIQFQPDICPQILPDYLKMIWGTLICPPTWFSFTQIQMWRRFVIFVIKDFNVFRIYPQPYKVARIMLTFAKLVIQRMSPSLSLSQLFALRELGSMLETI